MHYEPNRYHLLPFGLLYKFVTGNEYEAVLNWRKVEIEDALLKQRLLQQQLADQQVKASTESVFALAQDLNKQSEDDSGIYSDKHEESEEEEVVIQKDKRKSRRAKKEMTFVQ